MKFKQLENTYFQSEDGCLTVPNVPGNRHYDRIADYMAIEAKELDKDNIIDIPDDWQKPELVIKEMTEEPIEQIEPV